MRIETLPSAKRHLIAESEIHTAISYPEIRIAIESRRSPSDLILFIARPADNQPHIEVIADLIDPTIATVFHAMMLRPSTVAINALEEFFITTPDYAPQRA